MANLLFDIKVWLRYQLKAHYRRGHHVHSPYTYRLFRNVLFERWPYYSFNEIEKIRKNQAQNGEKSDNPKYTQLLQRLCATNNAKTIIEIGRTNGISTMYLASNNTHSTVYSISDKKPTDVFIKTRYTNIHQCKAAELQRTIDKAESIDILYVRRSCGFNEIDNIFDLCKPKSNDGSIFIFDDIHKDSQTEKKWENILESDNVTLSLDLYRVGLVWFKKDLKKQHYTVKY
ncbi:MAG: class I SAM-dependent methyltransferase [Paludibacteraceae bacterium]|nr:class I SAM-dependent methyltransferase [Paludibacteraceae bacterium]